MDFEEEEIDNPNIVFRRILKINQKKSTGEKDSNDNPTEKDKTIVKDVGNSTDKTPSEKKGVELFLENLINGAITPKNLGPSRPIEATGTRTYADNSDLSTILSCERSAFITNEQNEYRYKFDWDELKIGLIPFDLYIYMKRVKNGSINKISDSSILLGKMAFEKNDSSQISYLNYISPIKFDSLSFLLPQKKTPKIDTSKDSKKKIILMNALFDKARNNLISPSCISTDDSIIVPDGYKDELLERYNDLSIKIKNDIKNEAGFYQYNIFNNYIKKLLKENDNYYFSPQQNNITLTSLDQDISSKSKKDNKTTPLFDEKKDFLDYVLDLVRISFPNENLFLQIRKKIRRSKEIEENYWILFDTLEILVKHGLFTIDLENYTDPSEYENQPDYYNYNPWISGNNLHRGQQPFNENNKSFNDAMKSSKILFKRLTEVCDVLENNFPWKKKLKSSKKRNVEEIHNEKVTEIVRSFENAKWYKIKINYKLEWSSGHTFGYLINYIGGMLVNLDKILSETFDFKSNSIITNWRVLLEIEFLFSYFLNSEAKVDNFNVKTPIYQLIAIKLLKDSKNKIQIPDIDIPGDLDKKSDTYKLLNFISNKIKNINDQQISTEKKTDQDKEKTDQEITKPKKIKNIYDKYKDFFTNILPAIKQNYPLPIDENSDFKKFIDKCLLLESKLYYFYASHFLPITNYYMYFDIIISKELGVISKGSTQGVVGGGKSRVFLLYPEIVLEELNKNFDEHIKEPLQSEFSYLSDEKCKQYYNYALSRIADKLLFNYIQNSQLVANEFYNKTTDETKKKNKPSKENLELVDIQTAAGTAKKTNSENNAKIDKNRKMIAEKLSGSDINFSNFLIKEPFRTYNLVKSDKSMKYEDFKKNFRAMRKKCDITQEDKETTESSTNEATEQSIDELNNANKIKYKSILGSKFNNEKFPSIYRKFVYKMKEKLESKNILPFYNNYAIPVLFNEEYFNLLKKFIPKSSSDFKIIDEPLAKIRNDTSLITDIIFDNYPLKPIPDYSMTIEDFKTLLQIIIIQLISVLNLRKKAKTGKKSAKKTSKKTDKDSGKNSLGKTLDDIVGTTGNKDNKSESGEGAENENEEEEKDYSDPNINVLRKLTVFYLALFSDKKDSTAENIKDKIKEGIKNTIGGDDTSDDSSDDTSDDSSDDTSDDETQPTDLSDIIKDIISVFTDIPVIYPNQAFFEFIAKPITTFIKDDSVKQKLKDLDCSTSFSQFKEISELILLYEASIRIFYSLDSIRRFAQDNPPEESSTDDTTPDETSTDDVVLEESPTEDNTSDDNTSDDDTSNETSFPVLFANFIEEFKKAKTKIDTWLKSDWNKNFIEPAQEFSKIIGIEVTVSSESQSDDEDREKKVIIPEIEVNRPKNKALPIPLSNTQQTLGFLDNFRAIMDSVREQIDTLENNPPEDNRVVKQKKGVFVKFNIPRNRFISNLEKDDLKAFFKDDANNDIPLINELKGLWPIEEKTSEDKPSPNPKEENQTDLTKIDLIKRFEEKSSLTNKTDWDFIKERIEIKLKETKDIIKQNKKILKNIRALELNVYNLHYAINSDFFNSEDQTDKCINVLNAICENLTANFSAFGADNQDIKSFSGLVVTYSAKLNNSEIPDGLNDFEKSLISYIKDTKIPLQKQISFQYHKKNQYTRQLRSIEEIISKSSLEIAQFLSKSEHSKISQSIINILFTNTEFKRLQYYILPTHPTPDNGISQKFPEIKEIQAGIFIHKGLIKKIKKGGNINAISFLQGKYPSRHVIVNDLLVGKLKTIHPAPRFLNIKSIKNIIEILRDKDSSDIVLGLDDNRLNCLFTFIFGAGKVSGLQDLTQQEKASEFLDLDQILNKISDLFPDKFKDVPIEDAKQFAMLLLGHFGKLDVNNTKYEGMDANQIIFKEEFMNRVFKSLFTDADNPQISVPSDYEPDNLEAETRAPTAIEILGSPIKYWAEKRNHLSAHIKQIQKKIKSIRISLGLKSGDKLKTIDEDHQYLLRLMNEKRNLQHRFNNLRDEIGRYLLNLTTAMIYIYRPEYFSFEKLQFREGKKGYFSVITSQMFSNTKAFLRRINILLKQVDPSFLTKWVEVDPHNTSAESFELTQLDGIDEVPFNILDRKSNADYSYIILPPTFNNNGIEESAKGKIINGHENATYNIDFRGALEKLEKNAEPQEEP